MTGLYQEMMTRELDKVGINSLLLVSIVLIASSTNIHTHLTCELSALRTAIQRRQLTG
jgi:hypothetical protein